MRRSLSILVCLSIILSLTGCSDKSPRMNVENFEKYALSDLKLQKKEGTTLEEPGYYNMDSTIDNSDASARKVDHYCQVYTKSEKDIVSNMYMVYTDYQQESDARSYYTELVTAEKDMLASSTTMRSIDEGTDYLIVLTQENNMRWQFECLHIVKDAILFTVIIMATSDIQNLDVEWMKSIKAFFEDLRIREPLSLSPAIESLIK